MGLYLRKAFVIGPFRINLSKSGLGLSFGVTGARIGIGPNGPYFHAGREFIYYKKSLKNLENNQNEEVLEENNLENENIPQEPKPLIKKLYIYGLNFLVGTLLISLVLTMAMFYIFFEIINVAINDKRKPKIKRTSKRKRC